LLVLTRRKDESIYIGDTKVIVIAIQGDKVRLGIDAAPTIPVHREEVYAAIHKEWQKGESDEE
tara:strand:- start:4848 stop:5036 length:189 start_codon:yes stop_codon:yes gene_type:complete